MDSGMWGLELALGCPTPGGTGPPEGRQSESQVLMGPGHEGALGHVAAESLQWSDLPSTVSLPTCSLTL